MWSFHEVEYYAWLLGLVHFSVFGLLLLYYFCNSKLYITFSRPNCSVLVREWWTVLSWEDMTRHCRSWPCGFSHNENENNRIYPLLHWQDYVIPLARFFSYFQIYWNIDSWYLAAFAVDLMLVQRDSYT